MYSRKSLIKENTLIITFHCDNCGAKLTTYLQITKNLKTRVACDSCGHTIFLEKKDTLLIIKTHDII